MSRRPIFFLVDFEQVFNEIFFVTKSLFHFFVVVVFETFLQEKCSRRKKMKGSSCFGNTQKTNLR